MSSGLAVVDLCWEWGKDVVELGEHVFWSLRSMMMMSMVVILRLLMYCLCSTFWTACAEMTLVSKAVAAVCGLRG